jgi:cell wall-associated NlpC family hydrolase
MAKLAAAAGAALLLVILLIAGAAAGVASLFSLGSDSTSSTLAQAESGTMTVTSDSATAQTVLAYARAQLGVPYEWGGDGPTHDQGFDCSGLVQAAYAAAGITLPRTATDQYQAGKILPPGTALQPGDLLFFGTPQNAHHVGIYLGNGMMIDAPHTGAAVRIEDYHWPDYFGASRPTTGP